MSTTTRAMARIRKVPAADGKGAPFDAHGWSCPCGADQGQTVLATEADAQSAADMHTRESHLATVLAELSGLARAGKAVKGAKFIGDYLTHAQELSDGRYYLESAARGRYIVDHDGKVERYTDGPSRPE